MNIGEYCPEQYISYCMSLRVQYDILRGTMFTNIHAIILVLYSNTYFMPKAFFIYILCMLLYLSGILYYFKYSYLN